MHWLELDIQKFLYIQTLEFDHNAISRQHRQWGPNNLVCVTSWLPLGVASNTAYGTPICISYSSLRVIFFACALYSAYITAHWQHCNAPVTAIVGRNEHSGWHRLATTVQATKRVTWYQHNYTGCCGLTAECVGVGLLRYLIYSEN